MHLNRSFPLFFALFTIMFVMSGCLNEDNQIPDNCYDGILNNGEELIDCGGPICQACDPCENGQFDVLLGEQWVDCGGECDPCATNYNGQLDPGEGGIDCGGDTGVACGELCGDGLLNGLEEGVDCGGPDCEICPTCVDGFMNGDEIGIDCGGGDCDPCATNGNCTNGLLDGDELYVDCGGSTCPDCMGIITWKVNGSTKLAEDVGVVGSLAGTTIMVLGTTISGEEIGLSLEAPALGWQNGITILCAPATIPTACGYTDVLGVNYTSTFGGNVTVEVDYVDATSGGIIVGTFMGTVVDAVGASVNLAQGSFIVPIN